MNKKFNEIGQKIIQENIYLSLATTDGLSSWNSPVYFVVDKSNNFYFISEKNSKHSKNISKNPYVAVSIFNSCEIPEKVNGVQFDGLCKVVNLKELPLAIKTIYSKKTSELLKFRFKNYKNPLSYIRLTNFRIYKIQPLHFYILNPEIDKEDKRVEIEIK